MYYHKSGNLNYHVLDLYHGTSAFAIPDIMSRFLTPTLGAGCDALEAQFGIPVTGVYVAKSWKVASTYPIESTTGLIPQSKTGISGGSYVSLDGTPPLRAVVRVLADTGRQLWHKGNNQSMYIWRPAYHARVLLCSTSEAGAHSSPAVGVAQPQCGR